MKTTAIIGLFFSILWSINLNAQSTEDQEHLGITGVTTFITSSPEECQSTAQIQVLLNNRRAHADYDSETLRCTIVYFNPQTSNINPGGNLFTESEIELFQLNQGEFGDGEEKKGGVINFNHH